MCSQVLRGLPATTERDRDELSQGRRVRCTTKRRYAIRYGMNEMRYDADTKYDRVRAGHRPPPRKGRKRGGIGLKKRRTFFWAGGGVSPPRKVCALAWVLISLRPPGGAVFCDASLLCSRGGGGRGGAFSTGGSFPKPSVPFGERIAVYGRPLARTPRTV